MFEIRKRFAFSASHRLLGLPTTHKCSRVHGHNYRVEIVLAAEDLDERGMVVDYGDLTPLGEHLERDWDHRHLNDVMEVTPTAENVARHLYRWCSRRWPQTTEVRVSETPTTWASYRP